MTRTFAIYAVLAVAGLVGAGCSTDAPPDAGATVGPATGAATTLVAATGPVSQTGYEYPEAPDVPSGPLDPATAADLDTLFGSLLTGVDTAAMLRIGESEDPRVAWLLSDVLRFVGGGEVDEVARTAFRTLTGVDVSADPLSERSTWQSVTNHLFAWDLPAPPGYVDWKRIPFEIVETQWMLFFDDDAADIDWRYVSWGGVGIDDRELGDPNPCSVGCIPALDDPGVVPAEAGGAWYPDDGIVFGVVVDGEARAYPKNIMEVHEMVNDTLGGRRIAVPYCTLCGSAQGYFTDDVAGRDEPLVMRTSGLLSRSNKVMYELTTFSVFDTFLGRAVSGPLGDAGVELEQLAVVTSLWSEWKAEHPGTTIVAADGGIGRTYDDDPLAGRDDAGPIFPIGEVDPRLDPQTQVLGVEAPDGTPLAFPVDQARAALDSGAVVELDGVHVVPDGSGIRAVTGGGDELPGHQAFWFAWSQFHAATEIWSPGG